MASQSGTEKEKAEDDEENALLAGPANIIISKMNSPDHGREHSGIFLNRLEGNITILEPKLHRSELGEGKGKWTTGHLTKRELLTDCIFYLTIGVTKSTINVIAKQQCLLTEIHQTLNLNELLGPTWATVEDEVLTQKCLCKKFSDGISEFDHFFGDFRSLFVNELIFRTFRNNSLIFLCLFPRICCSFYQTLRPMAQLLSPSQKTFYRSFLGGNAAFSCFRHFDSRLSTNFTQLLRRSGTCPWMVAKKDFIFSTDSCYPDSIKSQERLYRGYSQKLIADGPATRKPVDFKLFLANEENKRQLCQLLLRV
ncbi:hypothetical protein P5673_021972 [Acropora cervicornis]|uniref:Uncharacterized protein n=1 Tax=Acropora cervicornis TaxID=6130 RepID=A0AAD9Q754_ACRCE|nr:hypothetical protein P5673_021972 [Acropora cervicornis]